MNLNPRHNVKEEVRLSVEVFRDALDLGLLPGGQNKVLGPLQQGTETVAEFHNLLETVRDLVKKKSV